MSILKELICTSTIIILVQEVPSLFTYCIISKPSICDISQHSYISKEREATYSYYGTLQVSKYKVTILFSRYHAGDLRIFAQLLALKFLHVISCHFTYGNAVLFVCTLHTWDNRVLLWCFRS